MSTTTLRLDDALKTRIAAAAAGTGKSAHAFLIEGIEQIVDQAEWDGALQALAEQRWAKIGATGKTVAWDDAKAYLNTRAQGGRARKPAARKIGR